jgi:NAD(P)H-quinone oxidoreductase subunit 5
VLDPAVASASNALVRIDTVTVAMAVLIALVGWVVVRFSNEYLAGDPRQATYRRRLFATLAAVSVVVVANHVVLLLAAWSAASIALHGLLTFYGDRRVAVAVAHKKFLLARCADACMVGAAVAFWRAFDTLRIDEITATAVRSAGLSTGARAGILLVAVAAVLKSAQLPFHGWLIQVMEAPTPVSALLHAGVVNLGGFVLLRFAPVVDRAVETRTLLVVVGTTTAVVAGLVMATRISIKVALAWSTCAQMGFMLVQCGLGLWQMALVHLLAHSVYKAHAFLRSGSTVRHTQRRRLAAAAPAPEIGGVATGAAIAIAAAVAVGLAWTAMPAVEAPTGTVWLMLGVVALAVVPLTTPLVVPAGARRTDRLAARALGIPLAYLVVHEAAGHLVPHGATAPTALLCATAVGFAALFVARTAALVAPDGGLARRLRPWIYAGLFVDDVITRAAFAISPPPPTTAHVGPLHRPAAVPLVPVR